MHERLPNFQTWFDLAVKALKKTAPPITTRRTHNLLIEKNDINPASASSDLSVAVGQTTQVNTGNHVDDIDLLRQDPSTFGSSVEKWENIAGNKIAKNELFNAVVMSEKFGHMLPHVCNILLFGPPGTGKTMMVNALAVMSGCTLFKVGIDSFPGKFQGDPESNLRRIFDRAKQCSPSIIFFDEVESLIAARTDSQSEGAGDIKTCLLNLLSEISDTQTRVMIVATTNRPHAIDTAFLRRFQDRIYVPLPDVRTILKIIRTQLQKYDHDPYLDTPAGTVQLDLLAGKCMRDENRSKRWFSGDDIVNAMKHTIRPKVAELIGTSHFEDHTLRDGQRVLYPCAPKVGAIKRKAMELDDEDVARTRTRPVLLSDIQVALSKAKSVLSVQEVQAIENWNNKHGPN